MIIPRYANIGENCGSAYHGAIRRYQSRGAFDHDIIYIDIHVRDIFIKEMICKENNYGK